MSPAEVRQDNNLRKWGYKPIVLVFKNKKHYIIQMLRKGMLIREVDLK